MIIVTRPSPYGEELVQLCHQAGIIAKHLPFFDIIKGQDLDGLQRQLDLLQPGDIVVVVSPQVNLMIATQIPAIRFPDSIHYFAVGEQTAKQLQVLSGQKVTYPPQYENSEGLIKYFQSIHLNTSGHSALILCGNIGRTVIKEALSYQGALVNNIQCYQRIPISYPMTILADKQRYSFVITSIEHLLQLAKYCSEAQKHLCRLIVSSERIMDAAKADGWQDIYLVASANNQNLFKTIATLCHNTAST